LSTVKVLFLIEGWISPAPRYRVLQYLDFLEQQGVRFEVRALHGHRYPFFVRWPIIGKIYKTLARARRWFQVRDAGNFDVVLLQRLTLPFSSAVERRLYALNPNVVFDFDDALYRTENKADPRRMRVFREVVDGAARVIAGSRQLAEMARPDTTVIPTVIDTGRYLPLDRDRNVLTIGWIGTYSNFPNLGDIATTLEDILNRYPATRLQIVADYKPELYLPRLEFVPWSGSEEIERLQGFDIGVMPLRDTAWNRGKCAFKLIQYMAVGIPVVASPVGANLDVVVDGETGILADDASSWSDALARLIEQPDLRLSMGSAGRDRCVAHFSVISQQQKFLDVLSESAAKVDRV